MKILYVLILTALTGCGEDIRDKVRGGKESIEADGLMDPNDSIWGFKIGISEDELLKVKGKAMGYVRIDASNSVIFFDTQKSFIFTNGKLSGGTVEYSLIDEGITRKFTGDELSLVARWKLDNGIRNQMPLEEVKKILGDRLKKEARHPSEYRQYYEDGNSIVYLSFSSSDRGGGLTFRVHAAMVVPK